MFPPKNNIMCFFFSLSVVDGFLAIVHHALVDVKSNLNFGKYNKILWKKFFLKKKTWNMASFRGSLKFLKGPEIAIKCQYKYFCSFHTFLHWTARSSRLRLWSTVWPEFLKFALSSTYIYVVFFPGVTRLSGWCVTLSSTANPMPRAS